jgi:hypothetical protein
VVYKINARYNDRNGVWVFDLIDDASQVTLVAGVPILIGCDLLDPFALSIGSMYAVDMSSVLQSTGVGETTTAKLPSTLDAGVDDLGSRVVVLYLKPGETFNG